MTHASTHARPCRYPRRRCRRGVWRVLLLSFVLLLLINPQAAPTSFSVG